MAIKNLKFKLHRLAVLIVIACISHYVSSAPQLPEPELSWKNVAVDGKKTAVFSLFNDSRGIMWLGTNRGLYFYDGVTTHSVGENELFGTQIYSIVEKDNSLFLGSNNGLLVYDYSTGTVKHHPSTNPKEIRSLLLADDGLWIGSLNGVFRLNLSNNELTDLSSGLPHKSVYSLLRDSRGIFYVGTYNGLARWDNQSGTFHPVKVKIDKSMSGSLFVNCLLESEDGESIYIGGEGFLYKYTPSSESWNKIIDVGNNNVKSLTKGNNGHVLIGTDNGVFDMFNDTIRHYRHDSRHELSLADNEIWCIYADLQHNIWTGHERGFSVASNSTYIRTIKLSVLANSGEGNEIHVIHRDSKSNLWLAGTNGAIKLSDNSKPCWYRLSDMSNSLSHNRVRSILEDNENRIWLATDAGINKFNEETNNFDVFRIIDENGEHNSNWVYALIEDGEYFWTGSFLNGLHSISKSKLNDKGGIIISDYSLNAETEFPDGKALSNNLVNNIIKDSIGNIWILLFRDNVLTKFNPDTKVFKRFDIFNLTEGGYPTNISIDRQGRIWCAYKGGVIIFNKNDNYDIIKFPYTNSDETILALGQVGDGMWVSTQSNVWSIDGHSLNTTLLPIPQKSYTAVYEDTVSNKVFLGGTDEILEVDKSIIDNGFDFKSIKMILNDRGAGLLNLSDIEGGCTKLKIPYGGSFTLVVSTLNYSPESVQRYMYKLTESPDDTVGEWIVMPEGSNSISFSDLKMGDYTLLVKTVGSPISPVAIPITVNPPLLMSWWAICVYILVAFLIVYWIIWFTRKRNLRSFREQERQAALENVEKKLTFLSTISHDLKTPLSMILGPVSLMKEKAKDAESKKSLEAIYDNAVRLNNMIHRTLELQHLEDTDENLLIISTFDVVEFCKGVFEVFQENNPQKKFIFHSSCTQLLIEADAVKFESVITNLLSNACKYSDDGATISLGISSHDNEVEIVVSDDGIGIADIDQSLVFQRMFRAPSTSKLHEGTGLGLYLIKKYLELMKGNINLYSKEGQGTSFVVTLPLSEKALPISTKNNSNEDSNKAKVLVVEDNLQISSFITEVLKNDYICLVAENGRAGLAIAASFLPDLIIADEMMPIMSGLEMVKRMKQHPRLSSTPIIMLTAKSDNKTEYESIKLGIDVFMTKPFEPTALLGRIKQLLKSRTDIKEKVRIETITEAEAKPIEAESINEKSLAKIAKIIEDNISDPDLNVNLLCEKSGIPNKQLYRLIKKYIGTAPLDYIRSVRLQKAAVLLSQHRFTVSEISYMVGFKSPSYFAKCFQNQFGIKPSLYQSDDESIGKKQDN